MKTHSHLRVEVLGGLLGSSCSWLPGLGATSATTSGLGSSTSLLRGWGHSRGKGDEFGRVDGDFNSHRLFYRGNVEMTVGDMTDVRRRREWR